MTKLDATCTFVAAAQEAIARIQAKALEKKKERDNARQLLKELQEGQSHHSKGEVAVVVTLAKEKSKELKHALDVCQKARSEVNATLKKVSETAGCPEETEKHQDACLELLRRWGDSTAEDKDRVSSLSEQSSSEPVRDSAGMLSGVLDSVLKDLQSSHKTLSFQADLLKASEKAARDTGYSLDNFAYGSTPYASFLEVFQQPLLQAKIKECVQRGSTYKVFGSSIGWLAFYGSLTYGLKTMGYEILESLVIASRDIVDKYNLSNLEFKVQDMLEASLDETGILFLTSQCWDSLLKEKTYRKIQEELPPGSVVIDYSAELEEYLGKSALECVAPVSWNAQQTFHVFVKKQ